MYTEFVLLVIVAVFALLAALAFLFIPRFGRPRHSITDPATALTFLKNSTFASRAKANIHLRDAFKIMNPFVNANKDFHDEYIKHAHTPPQTYYAQLV